MPEDPQLLTDRDVAAKLRVSPQTVRQLIRVGLLPSLKIGRARRVSRAQLDAFVAELHATGSIPSAWPPRHDRTPKGGPARHSRAVR